MKKVLLLMALTLAVLVPVFSQRFTELEFKTPFASRIAAEVNGAEIVISWAEPRDGGDSVFEIRRQNSPIDSDNLAGADVLAVVAPRIGVYTDTPEEGVDWWYAVITRDAGTVIDVAIPWRNALGLPVKIEEGLADLADAIEVTDLTLRKDGGSIAISYATREVEGEVLVFRSPSRPMHLSDMDRAVVVGRSQAGLGSMTDEPLPGIDWYYTALDADLFDRAHPRWMDGAFVAGPITPEALPFGDKGFVSTMRPAPLPVLRINRSMWDGRSLTGIDGELPDRQVLGSEALLTIAEVIELSDAELWNPPEPVILEVDKSESEDRKQKLLKSILDESFAAGEWAVAEASLSELSASNGIDSATKARIQFYLGQCRYFLDESNSAFLAFLSASDHYYLQSRRWMLRIYKDITPVG